MAVYFSQTLRAVKSDDYQATLIVSIMLIILLIAGALWFFLASISSYEQSDLIQIDRNGTYVAYFPAEAFSRIQPGQPARLTLDQNVNEERSITVDAMVVDIQSQQGQHGGTVSVYPIETLTDSPGNVSGQVEIEVSRSSPAGLILRAAGLPL